MSLLDSLVKSGTGSVISGISVSLDDHVLLLNNENGALYVDAPVNGVTQRMTIHDPSAVSAVTYENNSLVFKDNSGATIDSISLGTLTVPTLTNATIDAICT